MAPPGKPLRAVPAPVFPFAGKTVREQIAGKAKFDGEYGSCAACAQPGEPPDRPIVVDKSTSLCRPCWRAWRWSPVAEYEIK